ncbi:MAG: PilZ domain-containing protein [Proteobacteria bacterium]|nr:PilZ domain-containing protein [Pseudomonadota bacterium]
MQVEQRCDEQRIEISRPFEILDSDIDVGESGYTKNLSTSGMRARLDAAPSLGDIIRLNMVLENETSPLKTKGEVIWCAPDIYGQGAEVGLKFVSENGNLSASNDSALGAGDEKSEENVLEPGRCVSIDADGQTLKAIIDEVLLEDAVSSRGKIQINLTVVNDAVADASDTANDILEKSEDWKPHPFRDAKEWLEKYAGPVVVVVAQIAAVLGVVLVRALVEGWNALPEKIRRQPSKLISKLIQRLKLEHKIPIVRSFAKKALSWAVCRATSTKAAIIEWLDRRRDNKNRQSPPPAAE